MVRIVILLFFCVFPLMSFGQSTLKACPDQGPRLDCFGTKDHTWNARYVGEFQNDVQSGVGVLYDLSGSVLSAGRWANDSLIEAITLNLAQFPFVRSESDKARIEERNRQLQRKLEEDAREAEREAAEARIASEERERNRAPDQLTVFCVDSVRGGDRYGIGLKECAAACRSTYDQSMCSDAGRSGWQITGISARSSPPSDAAINLHSAYWGGACSCIGQNYVLTEIKALPEGNAASKSANREAELAKRERAIAEREKALLESENRRLKEELEALRKK